MCKESPGQTETQVNTGLEMRKCVDRMAIGGQMDTQVDARLTQVTTKTFCSDHFILFSEGCASDFSVLTIKQFVMCEKRLFFIILGNTLPFWDCLDGSKKIDRSNATHAPLTRELCLHGLVEMH